MFARVVISDAALSRVFDYEVPRAFEHVAIPGAEVRVPFGSRTTSGVIIDLCADAEKSAAHEASTESANGAHTKKKSAAHEEALFDLPPPVRKLRAIISVGEPPHKLLPSLVRLAVWLANYYCAPIGRCLQSLVPAPVRSGSCREKKRLYVEVCKKAADFSALTARQKELLADIKRVGGGWMQQTCKEFSCSPTTLHALCEKGFLTIEEREMRRDPLARRNILPSQPLPLNPAQKSALDKITSASGAKVFLLFGVTGSGKTEVYLQAIARALENRRGAIVLVPEIALTPQTVQRFASRFGKTIAVLHSALSDGERYDEWRRIRSGEARVVVGPRSAVFAPVENLGLIIVDEEHEPSYKQEDTPRYNARDVAIMRGQIEQTTVILGTATPSLESWHNVQSGKFSLLRLPARAAENAEMPFVHIVDLRRDKAIEGRVNILSRELILAMRERLARGEQIILFLNRRGYATSCVCPSCGYVETCTSCDIPFTFHRADNCLRCHSCGAWEHLPQACPNCGDPTFKFAGVGTQRVEQIVARCFPGARVERMDADSTARKRSHDEILGEFRSGRADILIGTQMIAKGLHFPNVTLVGIILADGSLTIPDFRAAERTFQLLTQVAGRSGRGAIPGEVFIQTYIPDHPAIRCAKKEDFEAFAATELPERQALGYPPFTKLACVTLRAAKEKTVTAAANAVFRRLQPLLPPEVILSEPNPSPFPKSNGEFRSQIIIRAPQAKLFLPALRALAAADAPRDYSLTIDIDAQQLL